MVSNEVYARVLELLARQGWVSYQTLRRRFGLDEAALAALTQHLLATQPVAMDDAGTRLVWQGELRPAYGPTRPMDVVTAAPSEAGAAPWPLGDDQRRAMMPLVGRTPEVELLLARWARVQAGQGQVVALCGEAGIGKSRLVQVVSTHVAGTSSRQWACHGASTTHYSAFAPIINLLEQVCAYQPDDNPAGKLQKLETTLASFPLALPETVPLLAALLAVPLDDRYPPLQLTPERQRQRTLETVLTVLRALTAEHPALLIVEDLHWVDPSTLELLSQLVTQAATAFLYLLLTWRPEFQPPWPPPAHQTTLTLGRLLPAQVEQLAMHMAGGKALPPVVLEQIVLKTEGVPLFVEELTQMVLTSGLVREEADGYVLTGPLPPLAIPPTVHDSIVARLDQIGEAKAVAQVGAVWGRGFTEAQLQAVAPLDRQRLEQAVARLVEADILREVPLPPRLTYVFKHTLLQEAAYASLPLDRRQQVHGQVAQVLAERSPEAVETRPELLAQHYTAAGLIAQAIPYWQRAGQRAAQRSANIEAISHLTNGLEWLKTLPDTPERSQQELHLQTTLGPALMAIRGFASPEAGQAYARARALCQQVGDTPQLLPVLLGLCHFYSVRAQLPTARELAVQLLTLAEGQQDTAYLVAAHQLLGATSLFLGELTQARSHLEQSLVLYHPQQNCVRTFLSGGLEPETANLAFLVWTFGLLGYQDLALTRSHEALTLAQALSYPFSVAFTQGFAARLHQLRRESQAAQAQAEAVIALCHEQGFAQWLGQTMILRGWALAEQGQATQGIAQIRQGLEAWRGTGAELGQTYYGTLLAEACGKAGAPEDGLHVIAEALAQAGRTGERFYAAELHRLKGELLLARSRANQAEAEICFHQALDVARRQQAKSLQLRAAMSLAHLWQQQGRRSEARELLAPIYGWFTEGFDTADLQEARTLLEELEGCA